MEEFPGPVWYIKHLTGSNYLARLLAKMELVQMINMDFYTTNDLKNWTEIERFKRFFTEKII